MPLPTPPVHSTPPAAASSSRDPGRAHRAGTAQQTASASQPSKKAQKRLKTAFESAMNAALSEAPGRRASIDTLNKDLFAMKLLPREVNRQNVCKALCELKEEAVANFKEQLALLQGRKQILDRAYQCYREAKACNIANLKGSERIGDLLRERNGLAHRIALVDAILQLQVIMGPASAKTMNDAEIREKHELKIKGLEKLIDQLRPIPGNVEGIPILGLPDASVFLIVVLDMKNVQMEWQLQFFAAQLDFSVEHAWPVFGPEKPPQAKDTAQADRPAPMLSTKTLSEWVDSIDRAIYHNELSCDLMAGRGGDNEDFLQHRADERMHLDYLLLRFQHKILDQQAHYPAAIARALDVPDRLYEYLVFKVSKNLQVVNALFQDAQNAVSSSRPVALFHALRERVSAEMSLDRREWSPEETKKELEERYRLLRPLPKEFLQAACQLETLALDIEKRTKPSEDRSRARDDLRQMADDYRKAAEQIRTHAAELVLRGVDKSTVGESPSSIAALERLREISWSRRAPAPATQPQSKVDTPVEEAEAPAAVKPESDPVPATTSRAKEPKQAISAKATREFENLGTLAEQSMKWAKECVRKLEKGDTHLRNSVKQIRAFVQTAADYRQQQLASRAGEQTKEKLTRKAETEAAQGQELIAQAIPLRPTPEEVKFAIENGMDVKVSRPVLLPFSTDGDFVQRYYHSINGRKFKLHAHYPVANPGIDDKPFKVHYKRDDEAGGDDDDLAASYYADGRRARAAYRSEEAHEAIEMARQFLPRDQWTAAKLPDRSRR